VPGRSWGVARTGRNGNQRRDAGLPGPVPRAVRPDPAEFPDAVAAQLPGERAAQRAINFARSTPAVTAPLVGTGSPEHVPENVDASTYPPLGADTFDAIFE